MKMLIRKIKVWWLTRTYLGDTSECEELEIYGSHRVYFNNAKTIKFEDYVKLPSKEREWCGFYQKPSVYEFTGVDDMLNSHDRYDQFWSTNYPIQYFFRDFIPSTLSLTKRIISAKFSKFKVKFFTENGRYHKYIPKEFMDEKGIMEEFNFNLIKDYTANADKYINWDTTPEHKTFRDMLTRSVHRIDVTLPYIDERIRVAYSKVSRVDTKSFETTYKYVHYWEALRERVVDKVLLDMVNNRGYFWI